MASGFDAIPPSLPQQSEADVASQSLPLSNVEATVNG